MSEKVLPLGALTVLYISAVFGNCILTGDAFIGVTVTALQMVGPLAYIVTR